MFGKEKKQENQEVNNTEEVNTSNIFDDFEVSDEEVIEETENKNDLFDYLNIIGSVFKYINFLLFFIVIVFGAYIYIQINTGDIVKKKDYLNPICNLLTGNKEVLDGDNCSSITILNDLAAKRIDKIKKDEFEIISKTLKNNFELYSISNSKEILFILDKTKNKYDQYKILNEFDSLKSEFTQEDPLKIQCNNIKISGDILDIKCSAFAQYWQGDIPGFNGELSVNKIHGTTRTLAMSFINFLEKSNKFSLINKQKTFSINPYFGEYSYSYKTDFKISLKLNKNFKQLY